jgi:hypothetical protein
VVDISKREEKRKLIYNELIKAGYSVKESRRLRDISFKKLETYIIQNNKTTKGLDQIGKIKNVPTEKIEQTKQKINPLFSKLTPQKTEKKYLDNYNYIVRYVKGRKQNGRWQDKEIKFLTITSNRKKYKYEIIEEFWVFFGGSLEGYNEKEIISSSVRVVDIFIKE